jgi:hypothetical protein
MIILIILWQLLLPVRLHASDTVTVGAYINDIQNFNLNEHSYVVDLYLWFRWNNPKINPAESFEFMNSFDQWGHTTTPNYEAPIKLPSGEIYQVVRILGGFSHKFNLKHYPFDRQALTIEIEDRDAEAHHTQYIADTAQPVALNPKIELPGFDLSAPNLSIKTQTHPSNFGDTRTQSNQAHYTRAIIEVPIGRPVFTYLVKLILPVLCVVFCAGLMLSFKPTYVDARVGIGITALLTLVALQITLNDELPEIDYLILMDKIYLLTYIYIVLGLTAVVLGTWRLDKNAEHLEQVMRSDRKWLVTLSLTYTACLIVLLTNSIT